MSASAGAVALRRLASMPFLDRLELAAAGGVSDRAAYRAVAALERRGLVRSLLHGTERLRTTRRYHLTAAGLDRLAAIEDEPLEALLRARPVSAQWRRILLERLDSVAAIYRLAASIAALRGAIGFRWYRAQPMDASVVLPDGAVLAVVRQGPTADRTGFAKRLWRLREGPDPGGVLLLAPDETRLRHARRLLAAAPFPVLVALEGEAVEANLGHPVWRPAPVRGALGLREALAYAARGAALPAEREPARATLLLDLETTGGGDPGWLLPARLGPAGKRTLNLVSDWPWIAPRDLAALLGCSRARASRLVVSLEALGLVARVPAAGGRLAATDRGLAVLARRDRTAVGLARNRWSPAPLDLGGPGGWRDVRGRNSRQLLRHLDHTTAVHGFIASLAEQAREEGWKVAQLDPPRRASRYFRHSGRTRSVHPDASGVLRRGGESWAFFLEWERRAVRPSTMAARLAPYLRYYASHRPTDDHGVRPALLVVLRDEITTDHFLRVASREMDRARVRLPLWVAHEALLDAEGPFGGGWRSPGGRARPVARGA
ncbi:MAG: helix-turn-helix domain-containing protein [Chloroflexota bacterium]|nr:helix-turn-helix domain-containing protein [Chloroflexota bacterium]